jgi:hypothetical protein
VKRGCFARRRSEKERASQTAQAAIWRCPQRNEDRRVSSSGSGAVVFLYSLENPASLSTGRCGAYLRRIVEGAYIARTDNEATLFQIYLKKVLTRGGNKVYSYYCKHQKSSKGAWIKK